MAYKYKYAYKQIITTPNIIDGYNYDKTWHMYYIFTYCLKLYELASMMTLYELGNVRMVADHYNIREVYNFTDKTTPVVFISPFPTNDMETAGGTNGKHIKQCQQPIQSCALKRKVFPICNK